MNQPKQQVSNQEQPKTRQLIQWEKNLGDTVQNRVDELTKAGRLDLPANYSVGNALQSAWLKILKTLDKNDKPALEVCTMESVANALLDMTTQGLNPTKDHGYFIVYGNQLTWFTSYFGKCAALKRITGIETEPIATVIYGGDEIEVSHNQLGEEIVTAHKTSWANKQKGDLVGVYATVMYKGIKRSAVLTLKECLEAWKKSKVNQSHAEYRNEYMKRTAINRLVKMILKTTNDDDLLAETMIQNEQSHYDYAEAEVVAEEQAKLEIATNANKGPIVDFRSEEKETIQEPTESEPVAKTETSKVKPF